LWDHPLELDIVLKALAAAKLPQAEAILGVPTGGSRLADALVDRGLINLPIINLERVPGGKKQDFRFAAKADEELASRVSKIRIYEDVVSTLSSVAGAAKLFPNHQVHSLAIWRRGKVKKKYQNGIADYYLVEKYIPSFSPNSCPHPDCKK